MNLAKQWDTVNIQKLKAYLYTYNEISEIETGGKIPYYSNKKNKVPRNKLNQGGRPVLRKLQNTEERN